MSLRSVGTRSVHSLLTGRALASQCHARIDPSRISYWNKQSKKISLHQAQRSLTIAPLKNVRITPAFFSLPATAVWLDCPLSCPAGSLPDNWQAIEETRS
jgi:hypothetical protein